MWVTMFEWLVSRIIVSVSVVLWLKVSCVYYSVKVLISRIPVWMTVA